MRLMLRWYSITFSPFSVAYFAMEPISESYLQTYTAYFSFWQLPQFIIAHSFWSSVPLAVSSSVSVVISAQVFDKFSGSQMWRYDEFKLFCLKKVTHICWNKCVYNVFIQADNKKGILSNLILQNLIFPLLYSSFQGSFFRSLSVSPFPLFGSEL